MVTASLIKKLKQVNVSEDAAKTMQRANEVWKTSSKSEQGTIMELTGLSRASIQRSYKTGHISAKIVLAMAQTLNLDPLYLTGIADEKGSSSNEQIMEFLRDHGYKQLVSDQPLKKHRRRSARIAKDAADSAEIPSQITLFDSPSSAEAGREFDQIAPNEPVCAKTQDFVDSVTEEELVLLVKTVLLRAKAGGVHAERATQLKLFLLD